MKTKEITVHLKQQRARARRRKPPLLGARHVTINLARMETHRADHDTWLAGPGKRFHHVVGHLRKLSKPEETPRDTFIRPHFRGDASLGIVERTERRVTG